MGNLFNKKIVYTAPDGSKHPGRITGPLVIDPQSKKVPGRRVEGNAVVYAEGYEPRVDANSCVDVAPPANGQPLAPGEKSVRYCVNIEFTYPDGRKGELSGVSRYDQLRNTYRKGYYEFAPDDEVVEPPEEPVTKEEQIAQLKAIIENPKTSKKKKEAAEKELAELEAAGE